MSQAAFRVSFIGAIGRHSVDLAHTAAALESTVANAVRLIACFTEYSAFVLLLIPRQCVQLKIFRGRNRNGILVAIKLQIDLRRGLDRANLQRVNMIREDVNISNRSLTTIMRVYQPTTIPYTTYISDLQPL